MKPNSKNLILLFILSVFSLSSLLAQPANNTCASATTLSVGSNCSTTAGTLYQSTTTNITGGCGNRKDVWYKFTVPSYTVTVTVNLVGSSNLTTANTYIELFNTNNCTLNGNSTGGCNNISTSRTYSNLIAGSTYYLRINTTVATPNSSANFNICLTAPAGSRMKEVFKQTVLSAANVLNYPWEITYGPDDSLWVTESKGYKLYKINPNNGGKRVVLDLSSGSNWISSNTPGNPTALDSLDAQNTVNWNGPWPYGTTNNPIWPQGGFAGMALHPNFGMSTNQDYVYVSYVYKYITGGGTANGIIFRNKLVRFTFNNATGKCGSPLVLCDTLPGSSDHNSQRMIVASVTPNGPKYLFYGQGDMGAGQFGNRDRPNRAQNPASYEGKILRFNLDTVGGAPLVPVDNPYSSTSAVWSIGFRNNQGFAYDTALNILYGSMHGAYSDDEINIIQPYKNYGHPLVVGYADGNYNGNANSGTNTSISAGAPFTDNGGVSSCPPIGNEASNMNAINAGNNGFYKGPLFSAYTTPAATITTTWQTNPGNANWYSEAWSGLDLYTNKVIPGWKKSLVAAGLKWGRLIRLPLGATGITTMPSNSDSANTADTITYFQSTNRYRDLAFDPNGKDIYIIMDNNSATSGPGVGNPTVPACPGCVIKYTYLGYADEGGLSSIPKTIPVTDGAVNTCNTGTQVTIDDSNNFLWVPITGPDGNIMAEINAMGQNLGLVTSSFYKNSGAIRVKVGYRYLDRNITISPAVTSFGTPVKVRLYISKAEYDALAANPLSGVTNINQLRVLKNNDPCSALMTNTTTVLTPTNTQLADLQHGTDGYVLQVDVTGFSSFYFGSSNIIVPLNLITFTGSLQNNTATLLNWKTNNEINTSQFIIERSADGLNFNQIGTVAASVNTSGEVSYSYTDFDVVNVLSKNVFYRLKMVDIGGAYKYSNTINVALPTTKEIITVSPNPAFNELKAKIMSPFADNAVLQVVDNAGRILMSSNITIQKGNNEFPINVSKLAAGSYYLKISGDNIDSESKFQKL